MREMMVVSKPLVSIVIPVYNGRCWLNTCIECVQRQTYQYLEVVLVDDGSTDNSREIIETIIRQDRSNIKYKCINQENAGQGGARNTGIKNACGKYIVFMDQDDKMPNDAIEHMLTLADQDDVDIILGGYARVSDGGKCLKKVLLSENEWAKYKSIAPWGKLYRRDFLVQNDIFFLPTVLGEDIYFMMQAYAHKPKVMVYKGIAYYWILNEISVSNTKHKKVDHTTTLLELYEKINHIEMIENLQNDKLFEYFLIKTAVWQILYTARFNDVETIIANEQNIWGWMEQNYPLYQKNPYIGWRLPRGEHFLIRLIVWLYMKSMNVGANKVLLKVIGKH